MKKIDFLFIYEVKSREIENICLIKYELEKRGYTVEVINTWYYLKKLPPKYSPEVIITFALYNDETYKFISTFSSKITKIMNLQWEQIGSVKEETDTNSLFFLDGISKYCVNVCWGENTYNRLKNVCRIGENNLLLSGHITLDFLRNDLKQYYYSKEFIMNKYDIPQNKRICIFVSSFSYVNLPESIANQANYSSSELSNFIKISNESQKMIIKWIADYLEKNDDVVFIYRPHPAEAQNESIMKIAEDTNNFRIISDYSVKQWAWVSDIVYMWYSTSIAEAFYSQKSCYILRPLEVPSERELGIYKEADFITNYKDFEYSVTRNDYNFPISQDVMNSYYHIDYDTPTYIKICNKLEEMLFSNEFILPKLTNQQRIPIYLRVKRYVYRSKIRPILEFMSDWIKIDFPYHKRRKKKKTDGTESYILEMIEKNYVTQDEILTIQNDIKNTLKRVGSEDDK